MELARPRAGDDRNEGVPAPASAPARVPGMRRPRARFVPKLKKHSNFLKCPPGKSLERDETNQINNRHDEPGIGQEYY